jgi:hemoglobin
MPPSPSTPASPADTATPFVLVGGLPVVREVVERFYDLMEHDPAYARLRALHAADLVPMRASLAGFLAGWLGGPRDWFEANPGKCMMSMHRGVTMDADTAGEWARAMECAIMGSSMEPAIAAKLATALCDLARRMAPPA